MKVLIHEPNEDTRRLYQLILSHFPLDITFTRNIEEAYSTSKKEDFNLILLELGYSPGEEIQLAQHIVTRHPLVIVSSIPVSPQDLYDYLKRPVRLLMKPLNIEAVRDLIQKAMPPSFTSSQFLHHANI